MDQNMITQSSNKSSGSQLMANYVTGKVTTIEQARKANVPTLNGLTRQGQGSMTYTRAEVVRQIAKWLIELNELMDLKKPMNKGQIITCAEMILTDYGYLKHTDIQLFFTYLVKGRFGQMYESLSMTKILSFLADYAEDRIELAAQESRLNHDKIVSRETDVPRTSTR